MFQRLPHIVADHRDDILGFYFTIGHGSTVVQITDEMQRSVFFNDKKATLEVRPLNDCH